MKPFKLKIITPEKTFFDGETEHLIARTSEGDVGILYGHTPYVANLVSGPMKIRLDNSGFRTAAVSGGVLKASPEETVVLVSAVEWAAKRAEDEARRRLKETKSQKEFDLAEQKLKRALNRLTVAGKM